MQKSINRSDGIQENNTEKKAESDRAHDAGFHSDFPSLSPDKDLNVLQLLINIEVADLLFQIQEVTITIFDMR